MPVWMGVVFAVLLLVALAIAARRATTVLVVEVARGRVVRASGRAPGEMLRDLGDAVEAGRASGRVELLLADGGVDVLVVGLDAGASQRVRNVVGRFPAARLKTAPRVDIRRAAPPDRGESE